ncbi:MAG: NAD-dependent epimerase/dehydratase family protein [Candidatus Hydrogenedentes bacterium]|nr:NAD-dependent epimerase/dehydratase family protein [Candidatus Hydrogenedentota bacterium]
MIVAVTGASGHVGANLVRMLLDRGDHVRALIHRDRRAVAELDVEECIGDLHDMPSVQKLVDGAEAVFHLAANITLKRDRQRTAWRTNVDGARNVAEACLRAGVRRLVHFSSIHALSPYPQDALVTESRPLAVDGRLPAYDRSKAAAEQAVVDAVTRGLDAVIVNPTAMIGPYDFRPSYLGSVLIDVVRGKLPVLVRGGFDWVDVRDVSVGALAAMERGTSGERYLLSGHYRPLTELAAMTAAIAGSPPPHFSVPLWTAYLGLPFVVLAYALRGKPSRFTSTSLWTMKHHQQVSHEKATRELGYQSRPLEETIRDTLDWFRAAGLLRDRTRHV